VRLQPGAGSWSNLSDREVKENFKSVDGQEVLKRLEEIPITSWNYKAQRAKVRHIGPTAQDFHAAFGFGESNRHMTTGNVDGVALAAIKELHEMLREQKAQIDTLKGELGKLTQ